MTVKPGVRALGVAESFRGEERSSFAGVVVRASRVVDGFAFATCAVGGTDATDAISALVADLGREDVRYVFLGAVAPAWYNLLDLESIAGRTDRPVIAVTFEASDGLESGLREAFDGEALERRLATYRRLPPRRPVAVGKDGEETVYVRAAGLEAERAAELVRAFTPEGGRPEPLRVARLAARAADEWRTRGEFDPESV